jgi:hypothetical protein
MSLEGVLGNHGPFLFVPPDGQSIYLLHYRLRWGHTFSSAPFLVKTSTDLVFNSARIVDSCPGECLQLRYWEVSWYGVGPGAKVEGPAS